MLTETEVWALIEGGCNRREVAAACNCDETVAKALMVRAAMTQGMSESPRVRLSLTGVAALKSTVRATLTQPSVSGIGK